MYKCKQVVDRYQLLQSESSNQRQMKQLQIIKLKPSTISFNLHWCPIGSYSSNDPQTKSQLDKGKKF